MYICTKMFSLGELYFVNWQKTNIRGIFREIMNTVFKSHAGNMSANTENFIVVFVVFLLLFFCLFFVQYFGMCKHDKVTQLSFGL